MKSEKPENFQPGKANVFVFGSNEAGRHGAGAALWAMRNAGAKYGQGEGLQGNSYGIPTKDYNMAVLPLDVVRNYIRRFFVFAKENPELTFYLTPVGTGYSRMPIGTIYDIVIGYIGLFKTDNVILTDSWYG